MTAVANALRHAFGKMGVVPGGPGGGVLIGCELLRKPEGGILSG